MNRERDWWERPGITKSPEAEQRCKERIIERRVVNATIGFLADDHKTARNTPIVNGLPRSLDLEPGGQRSSTIAPKTWSILKEV